MPDGPIAPSRKLLESTILAPEEERRFQNWVKHYMIRDIDPKTGNPYDDVNYDIRGYWKENTPFDRIAGFGPPHFEGEHGPDKFKQFGHPTFSVESKYAKPNDLPGMWEGDTLLRQPRMKRSSK